MNQNKQTYTPVQVVWETTLRCNLKCLHCGSSAGKARSQELSTKEAVQLCKNLSEIHTQEVCLMGGEPFLRDDWHIIAKQIKELNMKLLIISNGYNNNKKIVSKLVKLDPYSVSTSLDGGTAKIHDYIRGVKGSFDKVMEYISLSLEADLPTTVITTVSKINFNELPKIRDFLLNKNIAWQIQTATPEGRFLKENALTNEEYYSVGLFIASIKNKYSTKELPVIGAHCFGYHSQYLPWLGLYSKWNGCQAGISTLSIKSNGDIVGCLAIPNANIEGNVRENSLKELWNDPNAFAYNRQFQINELGDNCKECKYGETCRGGCIGFSTGFTNTYYNHPYCFYKYESENFIT
jgi:radical SAM protein with 4Fe4S-binding SPASM domain